MDRNMITVMSGQVVDFYDNDFRELYAVSDKLDLFKEFHLNKPQTNTLSRAAVPKRPVAATSRFQVNLGDVKVPAHKYHNPKYQLALGQIPTPTAAIQDFLKTMDPPNPENPTEELENITSVPSETGKEESKKPKTLKSKRSWLKRQKKEASEAVIEENTPDDASKHTLPADQTSEDTGKKKKRGFWDIFKKAK
ncbi:hypothetical protein PO909_006336 [Leuciscus waleckii]